MQGRDRDRNLKRAEKDGIPEGGVFMRMGKGKQQEKKAVDRSEKESGPSGGKVWAGVLYVVGVLLSGVFAAALAAGINGAALGIYVWPFAACVDLFTFSTAGFFLTNGKKEVLYGACSIVSAACGIVQLAILF